MKRVQKNVRKSKQKGSALIISLFVLFTVTFASLAYVSHATNNTILAKREALDAQVTPLCEAGTQVLLRNLWRPFKISQNFISMDATLTGASIVAPFQTTGGTIPGVGAYSAGVISYKPDPANPSYGRLVTIRCVGWIDYNNNGQLDPTEPNKTIDLQVSYSLSRSKIFDYTYFTNNFGWFDGFAPNNLSINGDSRANGDFKITNGTPTMNGSISASQDTGLIPPAIGLVTGGPYKLSDAQYLSTYAGKTRVRQGFSSTGPMGAYGSASWNSWKDDIYDSNAQIASNEIVGAAISDSTGTKTWVPDTYGTTGAVIDSTPTSPVVMPNLSAISTYQALSMSWRDPVQTYPDGTTNPQYNTGAYVKTWNGSSYVTVSTNGLVTGSVSLIGTSAHPVLIHGPVTISQDAVLSGNFSGQGTLYTGRNAQIVGSVKYQNPPNFSGTNLTTTNNTNSKADVLAIATEGSVIIGDTSQFNSNPLQYMEPPFTKPRTDASGNYVPAFNAASTDYTGKKLYQSTFGDSYVHSVSSSVDQIDAVMYSNNTIGGNLATDGTSFTLNGSMICKDDATVVWSSTESFNYDNRVKEQSITSSPLIDLQLPRSPLLTFNTWQDRGFVYNIQNFHLTASTAMKF